MSNEDQLQSFLATLADNPAALQAFNRDPVSALKKADLPVDTTTDVRNAAPDGPSPKMDSTSYQSWAHWHWWGVSIGFNEPLTQEMLDGQDISAAASVALSAGLVGGPITEAMVAVLAAGILILVGIKYLEIKGVDKGNGVYFNCSWPQWAGVAAGIAAGPAAGAAALEVFFWAQAN